jgi:hypothetical protein
VEFALLKMGMRITAAANGAVAGGFWGEGAAMLVAPRYAQSWPDKSFVFGMREL